MNIESVLLPTDFSDCARRAYPVAALVARRHEATLHLVHVTEPLPPHFYLSLEGRTLDVPQDAYHLSLAERLEGELASRQEFEGIPTVAGLACDGLPHEAIARYAKTHDAGMIVLATHGHTGFSHAFLGSFTEKVIRHSPVPVLTVRNVDAPERSVSPRTVVVPFDFSENAEAVLPIVRDLAESTPGARFVFVFAIEPHYVLPDPVMGATYDVIDDEIEDARERADANFQIIRASRLEGLDVSLDVVDGPAPIRIVDRARELGADLIVLATHGWTGVKHFFLGSVAEKIARTAPCSVLSVRPPEIRRGSPDRGA